jgi:hypothetical protein
MKSTLAIAPVVADFGAAAHAQPVNPDNDWASFFVYKSYASTTVPAKARSPQLGDVSPDGQFTYAGGERGWTHRSRSFEFVAGKLVHTQDCLPYDLPKPVRGVAVSQPGPFSDRGA